MTPYLMHGKGDPPSAGFPLQFESPPSAGLGGSPSAAGSLTLGRRTTVLFCLQDIGGLAWVHRKRPIAISPNFVEPTRSEDTNAHEHVPGGYASCMHVCTVHALVCMQTIHVQNVNLCFL